ncbi:MAG: response regulator [Synechococcales bacterium]|nr:response regulator [Synechococcales bacterium]
MNVLLENPQRVSLYSERFTALRHIQFLKTLARLNFSGQLVLTDPLEQQWIFYLEKGMLLYASGGKHAVRRWRRNLAAYCPQAPLQSIVWQHDVNSLQASPEISFGWEYALLCSWVRRKRVTARQAAKIIGTSITEILFDVAQAEAVMQQIKPGVSPPNPLISIEVDRAIASAKQSLEAWQNAMLGDYSPNDAPIIRQPEQIKHRRSAQAYQAMARLLDGRRSLRDLSVKTRRNVVKIAASLLPGIQLGWVELTQIPDFNPPKTPPAANDPPLTWETYPDKLIACIDDSLLIRQTMEELLNAAGYQFIGVGDALRALGVMMAKKPDLIFLDLVMPDASGYEICQQLRKLSRFRETPIIILTGNDGFTSRLRSNFVGASDFLSKPLDAGAVLSIIQKHLQQGAFSA